MSTLFFRWGDYTIPFMAPSDLHPFGGRRATIKAHPTTPHRPRPYGKGISPGRMESRAFLALPLCASTRYNERRNYPSHSTTAGDHKGPPNHSPPPSPLREGDFTRKMESRAFLALPLCA